MTSRLLRLALLIAVLLPSAALAETDPAVPLDGFERYDPAVDWLLEHDNPRYRAAGVMFRADRTISGHPGAAEELGARILGMIDSTTDGAALSWLASACRMAAIEQRCIETGLDRAIIEHDGANLFSRGMLVRNATEAQREAWVIEAKSVDTYLLDVVAIWFEALNIVTGPTADSAESENLIAAFAIGMAQAMPAFQDLSLACQATTPDTALDRACTRVLSDLVDHGDTTIAANLGLSLQARRAEARGAADEAARLNARLDELRASNLCIGQAMQPQLGRDEAQAARDYVKLITTHGELAGARRFAERYGIDCA